MLWASAGAVIISLSVYPEKREKQFFPCLFLLLILNLVFSTAKVVVELARCRLIQAAVLLHPSFVTLDDIKGMHDLSCASCLIKLDDQMMEYWQQDLSLMAIQISFQLVIMTQKEENFISFPCVKNIFHGWSLLEYISSSGSKVTFDLLRSIHL